MHEKRKFVRLVAPIGICYRSMAAVKTGQRKQLSLIKNISGGGIGFQSPEPFRLGDLLELEIQIPHFKEPVKAVGEVVRADNAIAGPGKELGVMFRDIEPKDLNRILDYVYTVGIGHE